MNAHEVTVWSVTPGLLSEGPRWHEERQELLWVDILGRQMHRGTLGPDGALERVETISVDRHIGAVAPAAGGGYVLAAGPGFLFVDDAGSVRELAQPEDGRTDVRMNDGACDPQGRFWAGTMAYDESPGAGALFRLELDGSCTTVLTGLTISNGIGWSPDASTMYLNDRPRIPRCSRLRNGRPRCGPARALQAVIARSRAHPCFRELVIPNCRWIAGAAGLVNLLLVSWIRAARRNKTRQPPHMAAAGRSGPT